MKPREVIVAGPGRAGGEGEEASSAGPVSYCSQPRDGGIRREGLVASETERKIKRLVSDTEEDKEMRIGERGEAFERVRRCQRCWSVIKKTRFIFYEGDLRCSAKCQRVLR